MNSQQFQALNLRDTDIKGAVYRCCGDENLYIACLREFLNDDTLETLNKSISKKSWDEAFTAAHALKGLSGNLGFVPLMHATGQLVVIIRGGRTNEIKDAMKSVESCYRDIIDAIKQFFIM